MACKDCLLNCPEIVSDKCIQYTGPEIPLLGICPGDSLSEFEAAITEELVGILDGTGIEPANVTVGCSFLSSILGSASPTLSNLLNMLITASCTLKELIDTIEEQLAENTVFNTACLTGLPSNPSRDDILQAAILLLCSLNTTITSIPTTYVRLSDLTNLVTQIFNEINTGGDTIVQNYTKMVPYTAMPYFGPLSNFDASGIGVASLGFEKIYMCNGANGTPDLRGRAVVGAIKNVPGGGALDAAVDPIANPNNPNWALNDRLGVTYHTLSISQLPSHTHTVTDQGHQHNLTFTNYIHAKDAGSTAVLSLGSNSASAITIPDKTNTATTGITIASAGGNQPHINIQPSYGAYYIIYIP